MRTEALFAAALLLAPAGIRAATEAELLERIEQLELRIDDIETDAENRPYERSGGGADWTRFVRIGGSASAGYYGGQDQSYYEPDTFQIRDTRLFVDAQLGEEIELFEREVFRNVGFLFEWNLVRLGDLENEVGELYADFQGFLGSDAVNFQVGRFQIPVGEDYLNYSQGEADKPFISNPVGGPWWWDEGVRFYGSFSDGTFGYVASVSSGDTPFNTESSWGKQETLRLFVRPTDWLYASVSGLYSGRTGNNSSGASAALWLGETWARMFGAGTTVANYQDGGVVPDGPNVLIENWLLGSDVIMDFEDAMQLWLAAGRYEVNSAGGSFYDRTLYYWIAEAVFRGAWISEDLKPFYVGARGSGLGTYRDDEGYALDARLRPTLGYNMEALTAWSAVFGWELSRFLRLRMEYTLLDADLVTGVASDIRNESTRLDYFGVEVGASF
jgi:hypothetical protein